MQAHYIVCAETPYCVWDWELDQLDYHFIEGIDPKYFEHVARTEVEHLEGEDRQRAALALRMTYSHAQETFFSLLAATIQAPDCVIAWLHKYRNEELDRVITKLDKGQPVLWKLMPKDPSWQGLSALVHQFLSLQDKEKEARIKREFGTLWQRLAHDFLDEKTRHEYNSIKHGLRARAGGFQLAVGLESTPGVPCPPDQMKSLGGSKFGSDFYSPVAIEGVEKCNIRMLNSSRNWIPEQLAQRIICISMSMTNLLSFLKTFKDNNPSRHSYEWPEDPEAFANCWNQSTGVVTASFDRPFGREEIDPKSKGKILAAYRNAANASSNTQSASPIIPPSEC